jgi:hypothetical protein
MGLVELLEQVRNVYLDQWLAVIDEKMAQPGLRVIAEPAWRTDDGHLALEGELQLPLRTDLAMMEGGAVSDMLNVASESPVPFDAVEFDWGKTLHVEMGPFAWQAFTITIPSDPVCNSGPLQEWFWKWFLEEEDGAEAPDLLGAVHYLSDPAPAEDVVEFLVDLGSAPVAAFEELLDALSVAGVTLCAIGNVPGAADAA